MANCMIWLIEFRPSLYNLHLFQFAPSYGQVQGSFNDSTSAIPQQQTIEKPSMTIVVAPVRAFALPPFFYLVISTLGKDSLPLCHLYL